MHRCERSGSRYPLRKRRPGVSRDRRESTPGRRLVGPTVSDRQAPARLRPRSDGEIDRRGDRLKNRRRLTLAISVIGWVAPITALQAVVNGRGHASARWKRSWSSSAACRHVNPDTAHRQRGDDAERGAAERDPREAAAAIQLGSGGLAEANPTSAVQGGQGRSFGHLGKKSPLHFGEVGDGRRHAEALREVEAEAVEQGGLSGVRAHDAAEAEFTPIRRRQDDVRALNATEFIEDRARTVPESGSTLPLLERLPQHVGEKADEDVGLDAIGAAGATPAEWPARSSGCGMPPRRP
jgi:hypothetical protein